MWEHGSALMKSSRSHNKVRERERLQEPPRAGRCIKLLLRPLEKNPVEGEKRQKGKKWSLSDLKGRITSIIRRRNWAAADPKSCVARASNTRCECDLLLLLALRPSPLSQSFSQSSSPQSKIEINIKSARASSTSPFSAGVYPI